MDSSSPITLRTKKLGVLIRDARLASGHSAADCARAMGVTRGALKAYEEGRRAPSLPEVESLAFFLKVPMDHFWGRTIVSDDGPDESEVDLPRLVELRQKIIGALLRQERSNAGLSIKTVAKETGIRASRISAYELGERPIPLPELEALVTSLSGRVDSYFDQSGPVGQWMAQQKAVQQFTELPANLQTFVGQPVNRPYLELAVKLSSMSTDKLRSVAEGMLDITM
jgi:transcriptional regulator with XRE-family HTH domain